SFQNLFLGRCHPMLSGLSSRLFYGGQVADGVGAADRPPLFPCTHLPALVFIDVASGEEASRGESITNAVEAAAVTELVRWTLRDARAPADAGARPVAKLFSFGGSSSGRGSGQGSGSGNGPDVQISTVDAFQGEERDVIVLTACRTRKMGFAACPERLNVALTRARHHLFVVANRRLLQPDHN
ncbi:unnamed protein product, partial [Phaeothamnion confervicola]